MPPCRALVCPSAKESKISLRNSTVLYAIRHHDARVTARDQDKIALLVNICYMSRMVSKDSGISVATRLNKQQYQKLLKRQRTLKQITGVEVSISAVLRSLVEEAGDMNPKRKATASG